MDSRKLLLAYYGLRGLSLLVVPAVLGPTVEPPLFFFIVFYGLDWVATVPPTVALCRQHFGLERSGIVFGWVFGAHMVGAGVAASVAGLIRTNTGDYAAAWYAAGLLCLLAAFAVLRIPRPPEPAAPAQTAPAPEHSTPLARPVVAQGQPLGRSLPAASLTAQSTMGESLTGSDARHPRRKGRIHGSVGQRREDRICARPKGP